jgi:hypothetical protein
MLPARILRLKLRARISAAAFVFDCFFRRGQNLLLPGAT